MVDVVLIFGLISLGAVWLKGKADTVTTASAVLLAWAGVNAFGWRGFSWDWAQVPWYLGLTLLLGGAFTWWFRDRLSASGIKEPLDLVALWGWGVIQQAVLISFLALVNPWLAVAVFVVVHLPNIPLAVATLLGGTASVAIASWFGEPSVFVAGTAHALLSLWLRDFLHIDMGVGRSYDG